MIELIRNCGHGSEIATYLATDGSGKKRILKTSTSPNGIQNLHNEVRGWSWYHKIRYPGVAEPACRIVQAKQKYLQIEIAHIDGSKPVFQHGLERNADAVRKVVKHYCDIWPCSIDPVPLHGDLSLDNIIMNSEGIHVIDWEHFSEGAAPWGFDAVYFLFETLYFGMRFRSRPTGGEIKILREQLNIINTRHKLNAGMMREPLRFLREFIGGNGRLWGEQIALFPMKLPVVAFTSDQITLIDKMVRSGAEIEGRAAASSDLTSVPTVSRLLLDKGTRVKTSHDRMIVALHGFFQLYLKILSYPAYLLCLVMMKSYNYQKCESWRRKYNISKSAYFVGDNIILEGDGQIIIGEFSHIAHGSWLSAFGDTKIEIGKYVRIAQNVVMLTANAKANQVYSEEKAIILNCGDIVIEDFAWIGCNVFIKEGVRIGRNVVVGANSVVVRDIPDNSVYVGNKVIYRIIDEQKKVGE
jgi:maltose O-acetyltransferase